MHSVWSLLIKRSVHKISFLWLIQVIATIAFMPFLVSELRTAELDFQNYIFIFISFLFQSVYLLLLAYVYKGGEMSQVYPLMRGTAALLIPLTSIILYHERLSWPGWLGLSLIVTGLIAISDIFKHRMDKLLLLLTGGVGVAITGYTLIDKSLLSVMSPVALLQIYNIAGCTALMIPALRSRTVKQEWRTNKWFVLLGAMAAPGSYFLFLIAMKTAPLSYISPIRELSIVFGSLLSWFVLKEGQGLRRAAYSMLVFLGIMIMAIFH
nr:DMT family transporter [Paenibacillus pinihumi]